MEKQEFLQKIKEHCALSLMPAEENRFLRWKELGVEVGLITAAYDLTFYNLGTYSSSYVNAIIEKWVLKDGLRTEEEAIAMVKRVTQKKVGNNSWDKTNDADEHLYKKIETYIEALKQQYGNSSETMVNVWCVISTLQKLLLEEHEN